MEISTLDTLQFKQYLESIDIAPRTIKDYITGVNYFLNFIQTEDIQITKPDVLRFLEHLKGKGTQNITRQKYISTLTHYFNFLFEEEQVLTNPCWGLKIRGTNKKRLYKIYTPAELEELLNNFNHVFVRNFDYSHIPKNKQKVTELCRERNLTMLNLFVNQGILSHEINRIEVDDIDFKKAVINIRSGKVGRKRTIPLTKNQIPMLYYYIHEIYPQLLEYQPNGSNRLFFNLPKISNTKSENDNTKDMLYYLRKQIKSIDKKFSSFKQIRASVITAWLKEHGLRRTQYLAGHKRITTTENYQCNNLDTLSKTINNLHPF